MCNFGCFVIGLFVIGHFVFGLFCFWAQYNKNTTGLPSKHTFVEFKRYLKWIFLTFILKTKVLKYLHKTGFKLVGLEINKGINDEYLWAFHGSVEELHVGGADQQKLEQQGLSNLVGRDRGFIMTRLSYYVVSGMHDKLGTLRVSTSVAS